MTIVDFGIIIFPSRIMHNFMFIIILDALKKEDGIRKEAGQMATQIPFEIIFYNVSQLKCF